MTIWPSGNSAMILSRAPMASRTRRSVLMYISYWLSILEMAAWFTRSVPASSTCVRRRARRSCFNEISRRISSRRAAARSRCSFGSRSTRSANRLGISAGATQARVELRAQTQDGGIYPDWEYRDGVKLELDAVIFHLEPEQITQEIVQPLRIQVGRSK